MNHDLARCFQWLDEFHERTSLALAPLRTEMATWYQTFFRRRKVPVTATRLKLAGLANDQSATPGWVFHWVPQLQSRDLQFLPTQPVPDFVTAADVLAMGLLETQLRDVRYSVLKFVALEAWEQAGSASYIKKLNVWGWTSGRPDPVPSWVDEVRAWMTQAAQKRQNQGGSDEVAPPAEPVEGPTLSGAILELLHKGDENAIADWAKDLDRVGETELARLLHWLPGYHSSRQKDVRAVAPQFGFALSLNDNGYVWSWIGDMCSEADNETARQLGLLFSSWNQLYPAMEWLLRKFGFPHVEVKTRQIATRKSLGVRTYHLTGGEHLVPLAKGVGVQELRVKGWEPIEGDLPGA